MAHSKRAAVSLVQCILLIPFIASLATATHSHHHTNLHRLARDMPGKGAGSIAEGFHIPVALAPRATSSPSQGQEDYTCGPGKPCSNEACCGPDGWCGYEPKYCGKGCQSNCDAKAECGKYAKKPGQECPLKVCCSQYGFCGTAKDFCAKGCQSNCEQPKPSASKSDSRQRIIGYWEGWNTDHSCGTMTLGEIPVDQLTHLNIAFGYIDKEFRITNMDGVNADLYKNAGNLKAKNPDLKIIIALGGWTFSDPGPWQDIFPSLAATPSNRAIFIKNVLGFLDEYGYDGVDFDWEYPGAKDRGGSEQDGANFVSLVKELRAAIKESGRECIVTYTAPTSYWYLRHFDPKAMEPYVDWINLMSYDLHGTWDSVNPIGSQVLAHSNLTEIDLALDLFWRVGVQPKNIVLGLGFYGRSFKLKSASCWKPGCRFEGPGDKGPCTDTAGILSYREIENILAKTGATSYHDKKAAVRYLVYGDNNWISYDDAETFKAKIDYANKMGLSGLMVWAIDQDDSELSALAAVTDGKPRKHSSGGDFDLVDLTRLFPKEDIPSDTSDPQYGLVTFGPGSESGEVDPANSGFGFILAVGESHGLTQLKKRDGRPDPFVFLDCPDNVLDQPVNKTQKARVVCTSDDVDGCFRVMERGVEGTLVEMPDECAPNSFARAISLELSEDQSIPEHLAKRHNPTSPIYEFSFDLDKNERRADAKVAIRMDITNVKGYWDDLVDSPGVERRDLERRYHSYLNLDWRAKFQKGDKFKYGTGESALKIQQDLSTPVFWQAVEDCPVGDKDYGEGIAAFIEGKVDANMYYAATVIAASTRGTSRVDVKEANGFIKVEGLTDLTFGIGGMGRLDVTKSGKGNPAKSHRAYEALKGHTISAGSFWGYLNLTPFTTRQTLLAAAREDQIDPTKKNNAATLNGRLTTRVRTDLGEFPAVFPNILFPDEMESIRKHHKDTEIEIFDDDVLYGDGGDEGSTISIGHHLTFGLELDFGIYSDVQGRGTNGKSRSASLLVTSQTYATWDIPPAKDDQVCPKASVVNMLRQEAEGSEFLGWESDNGAAILFDDNPIPNHQSCYSTKAKRSTPDFVQSPDQSVATSSNDLSKRGFDNPKDNFGSMYMRPNDALAHGADLFIQQSLDQRLGQIDCDNGRCESCLDVEETRSCCGCVCMQCKWGAAGDIPPCSTCTHLDPMGEWPGPSVVLMKRGEDQSQGGDEDQQHESELHSRARTKKIINLDYKDVKVCGGYAVLKKNQNSGSWRYPQFPKDVTTQWDGADGGIYDSISRYWGNSSADCADWSIERRTTRDVTHIGNNVFVPSSYQMEHVYEGQNLGQFFSEWLTEGKLERQVPSPSATATGKVDCKWISKWILEFYPANHPWKNPLNSIEDYSLLNTLWTELGNIHYDDRLTILQERLNRKKENLFDLSNSYTESAYRHMSTDEQWMTVKEIGLVFSYMNDDTVWGMWCDTYKGIYDRLDRFDKWYVNNKGANDPDVTLADEWGKYNRVVLDSAVEIYRTGWSWLHENRRTNSIALFTTFEETTWRRIVRNNKKTDVFRLSKLCNNLPPTKIV